MHDIVISYDKLNDLSVWLHDQRMSAPLYVEVGCGKDEYIIHRALSEPSAFFIGIENNGEMIWRLEKKVRHSGAENIRLLPYDVAFVLEKLLVPGMVTGFSIQFPDPWPKKRHHKRRFLNEAFVKRMEQCLIAEGEIFFATDVLEMAQLAMQFFEANRKFLNTCGPEEWLFDRFQPWRTSYEKKFIAQGKRIYYLHYNKRMICAS
ncbi:MAG: tRNA (guanosine(46)-N7)-methyltransferase TrmB [Chlamydiota bacterium]|nr:tRNA (guanosine(46)-N7)-methyltransferase TrmB [Chlamydiota bacterium]